jgi:hypothetical protein
MPSEDLLYRVYQGSGYDDYDGYPSGNITRSGTGDFYWEIEQSENLCTDVEGDIAISGYYNYESAHELLSPVIACIDNCRVTLFGSRTPTIQILDEGSISYYSSALFYFNTPGQSCSLPEPPELIPELPGHTCAEGFEVTLINNELYCTSLTSGETDPNTPPLTVKTPPPPGTPWLPVSGPGIQPVSPEGPSPVTTIQDSEPVADNFGTGQTVSNTAPETPSFCTQHPNSPICLVSEYSGSAQCTYQPTCSGDAIQCAIALETWKANCLQIAEQTHTQTIIDTYDDVTEQSINEQFGNPVTLEQWSSGIEFDVGTMMQYTPPQQNATCPEDITINSFGFSRFTMPELVIPMQPACDFGYLIKPIILLFGYLSMGGIYYRALVVHS